MSIVAEVFVVFRLSKSALLTSLIFQDPSLNPEIVYVAVPKASTSSGPCMSPVEISG